MNGLSCRLYSTFFIAIVAALTANPLAAQTTGSVVGSVRDSQGAVIPGATVSLVSETRGTTIAAQSTDVGAFEFTSVIADRYTLRITLQGFKTTERKNLDVSPGDRVVVGSIGLAVGDLEETVIVSGEAPMIQAQTGERSFTVAREQVENLPNSGRNFASFAALTPGVVSTGAAAGTNATVARLGGPSPAGGNNASNFLLDGVATIDTGGNGQALQLNTDAIAEVRVLTSAYQAEFGRMSGLQITGVTKSGSNQFHGSVYDLERNSAWNANSWVNVQQWRPEDRVAPTRLGLHDRRSDRQGGWKQPPVLLLRAPILTANDRRSRQSVPGSDPARAAGGLLADARSERGPVQSDPRRLHRAAVHGGRHARLLSGRRGGRPHSAEPRLPARVEHPEDLSRAERGRPDVQPRDCCAYRHTCGSAAARAH